MEQIIVVCDDKGNPTGEYIPKMAGVSGEGKKHLAITVVLYNSKGQILLQKRKHLVFDNLWDLTASTDLSHFEGKDEHSSRASHTESFEEAAERCLQREYGISNLSLKNLGGFSYFAKDGEYCENEYDVILIGEYNGEVDLNPEVGYAYKWMEKRDFLKDIETNPQKYTPWAIEGIKVLTKNKII